MEVAAIALAAEQVISTVIEGGIVAGYALRQPTMPLKATLSCIGSVPEEATVDSLARFSHTLSIIDGDAYVFGGKVSKDTIAGNEMHILKLSNVESHDTQYKCVPALGANGFDHVPSARAGHSACTVDGKIVVFGGYGVGGKSDVLKEHGRAWTFDPTSLEWSYMDPVNERYPQCHSHAAVSSADGKHMFIHEGQNFWKFDLTSRTWIELPKLSDRQGSAPLPSSSTLPNLAIAHDKLYLISGSSQLDGIIHVLDVSTDLPQSWSTLEFPTNPLTPGPRPRRAAGLHPISTGYGRTYLLLVFGAKVEANDEVDSEEQEEYWSDMWTLQLPSTSKTPANVKDATRESIGVDSGEAKWAEVEVVPRDEAGAEEGKSHPGPRAYFGSAVSEGKKVVVWGGLNARGEPEGDGWEIVLKF